MAVSVEPARSAGEAADREFVANRIAESNRTGEVFFGEHAQGIAECAAAMADRFFVGATLFVFGSGPHTTDAQHNSVEYVHPVLPGCRALPALSLTNDTATVMGMMHGEHALDVCSVGPVTSRSDSRMRRSTLPSSVGSRPALQRAC
jgi:hypothetical protein